MTNTYNPQESATESHQMLANVILAFHILLVAWIIIVPFIRVSGLQRVLHVIMLASIMMHWLANDDTCVLTLLECRLRGTTRKRSLIQRLVGPVYGSSSALTWVIAIFLFLYNTRIVISGSQRVGIRSYLGFKTLD